MHESVTLSLTGNTTILSMNYFPSLNVYEDSEIALLCLQTCNLFPSINSTNNRLEIKVIPQISNRYISNKVFIFILEEGCYEIEDINNKIAKELLYFNNKYKTQLSFDICIDPIDFRTYIKCNGILMLDVPNSIASVFGLDKRTYRPMYEAYRSEKAVNLNTINSIKVMCNIAHGSFSNHLQSHSIYEFFPSERTGSKVIQSPSNLIYYKLNKTNIDSITVQLVDQDHNLIDNFGETLTIVLHIKRHGSHY